MKILLHLLLLLSVCYMTGCDANEPTQAETEQIEKKQEKTIKVDEKEVFKKEEVAEMTQNILNSYYESIVSLGLEHNWTSDNPADFDLVKKEIQPYVSKKYIETKVKGSLENIYCQCDAFSVPSFDPEVRFTFDQIDNDRIEVEVLEPGSDMITMGYKSKIELLKEENKWKLNKLSSQSLKGTNLKLTKEEAGNLLSSDYQTSTFIKEFHSIEGSGQAYLFNIKSSDWEGLVAISSRDASLVFDYDSEQMEVTSVESSLSSNTQALIDAELQKREYASLEDMEIIDFHGDGFPEIVAILHTAETDTILIHEYDQDKQGWKTVYKEVSPQKVDASDTLLIFETMNLLEDDLKQQIVIGKRMGSGAFIGFMVLSEYNGQIEKVFTDWNGEYPSGEVIQDGKDLVVLSHGSEVNRFSKEHFTID